MAITDIRNQRPETYNWHFVDIPLAETRYEAAKHCKPSERGDCVVAELDRLRRDLQCAPTDGQKRDALRYVVHFIGDIHQPLHTVDEGRGGMMSPSRFASPVQRPAKVVHARSGRRARTSIRYGMAS
jgi:hypothetical protein